MEDLYVQEINHMKKELTADHEVEYLALKLEYEVREQQHEEAIARAKKEHVEGITEIGRMQEAETTKVREEHRQIVTDLQKHIARVKQEHAEEITEMGRSHEAKITRFKKAHWQIVTNLQAHHHSVMNRIRSEHILATTDLKQTYQVEISHSKAAYMLLARELSDAVTYQHRVSQGLQEGFDVLRARLNTIFNHQPRFDHSEGRSNSRIDLDRDS